MMTGMTMTQGRQGHRRDRRMDPWSPGDVAAAAARGSRRGRWPSILPLWVLFGLALVAEPIGVAQTRTAPLAAYCRSINLDEATAISGPYRLEAWFTTYDGSAGPPLHDVFGGFWFSSGELSPEAGSPGAYQTDYVLFVNGSIDSYGTIEVQYPTQDGDANGIPDFLQLGASGNVPFSGSVTRQFPSTEHDSISGQITRPAGAATGSYTATIRTPTQSIGYTGQTHLINGVGGIAYLRGTPNHAALNLTILDDQGVSTRYDGEADFVVIDSNTATFTAMRWVGTNNRFIASRSFSFKRTGARYSASVELEDGGVSSWRDYAGWVVEFTDANDADRDGIPDFTDAPLAPPQITGEPQSQTVTEGQSVSFSVVATGSAPLVYQWTRDNTVIIGATGATHTIAHAASGDVGSYRVTVTNPVGGIQSQPATLTVVPAPAKPVITVGPAGLTLDIGDRINLTVTATGTPPLRYSWTRDLQPLAGATGASLVIPTASLGDGGAYRVTVSNAFGAVTSGPAMVTVRPPAGVPRFATPQFSAHRLHLTASVVATHQYGLERSTDLKHWTRVQTFQATGPAQSLEETAEQPAQFYRLVEGPGSGAGPQITQQPVGADAIVGQRVVFTVQATGSGTLSYQWRRNGVDLAGATASTLTFTSVKLAQAGTYTVVVTDANGSVVSDPAELSVDPG